MLYQSEYCWNCILKQKHKNIMNKFYFLIFLMNASLKSLIHKFIKLTLLWKDKHRFNLSHTKSE